MLHEDVLADLPVFVAAAEAGGFAAAAAKLHLSRSAVGKSIARLEARLGVRMFHRTTRTLALTEDGQIFLECCQRALGELHAGQAMLDAGRREVSGRLRVSMPVLFGRQCVAPILTRFAQAHPKLELHLNFNDRPVNLVEDGFDLVVRNGPLQPWPGLVARHLVQQHMLVCAAPAYIEAHGIPQTLDELLDHRAVHYGQGGQILSWQFRQESAPSIAVTPPNHLFFDDLGAIRDAAVEGYGLAWLPYWLIRDDITAGRLTTVLNHVPSYIFDTHALWPQTLNLPLRVRLAIEVLEQRLPETTLFVGQNEA